MNDQRERVEAERREFGINHNVMLRAVFPLSHLRAGNIEMFCISPSVSMNGIQDALVYEVRKCDDGYMICFAPHQNTDINDVSTKYQSTLNAGLKHLARRCGFTTPNINWEHAEETVPPGVTLH